MIKSIQFFKVLFLSLLLILPLSVSVQAQDAPVLSVSGTGIAKMAPDQASLRLSVTTTGKSAQDTQAENASRMQAVIASVEALGVEPQYIETSLLEISPQYEYKNGVREIKGYVASNSVTVEIRDLIKVGRIADTALANGANQIDDLSFSLREPESIQQEALRLAILDARSKAEVMARALGHAIVGLKLVSETTNSYQMRNYSLPMLAEAKADSSVATPVQPGELEVTAEVHIEFLLSE